MTKKSESASEGTRSEDAAAAPMGHEDVVARKHLLARVAGHVAVGLLVSPSPKVDNSEKIATVAVDVAEAILRKVGL
jgi:hypothetical protein